MIAVSSLTVQGPCPLRYRVTRIRAGEPSTRRPPTRTVGPRSIRPTNTSRAYSNCAAGVTAAQLAATPVSRTGPATAAARRGNPRAHGRHEYTYIYSYI